MEQWYKHFSHPHNLIMHQMPEGIEVNCSGCNSSSTGTVYVCWQCNFFLHEQCYRATRSLKHPSHPSHPLSLVPYPSYPSNSFYCNSCKIIGTGFCYSCAACEFDLHVQCAYSISMATSFQNSHHFQEFVPTTWNEHNPNIGHNVVPFVSVPDSHPFQFTDSQNQYMPSNSISDEYHSTSYDPAYSIPPPSRQNSNPTTTQDPSMSAQNLVSHNPIANVQYSSLAQNGPTVAMPSNPPNLIPKVQDSIPQNRPSISIPPPGRQNSITTTAQDPSMAAQNLASDHNPIASAQHPSMAQTGPTVSLASNPQKLISNAQDSTPQNGPSISIPMSSPNPTAIPQTPSAAQSGPSVSIPTNPLNPITSTQDPLTSQKEPSVSSPTSSQNPTFSAPDSVSIPTNPLKTSLLDGSVPQNESKDKKIMHFSHPHNLSTVYLQEDEENEVTCSGCEDTIVGKGYSCVEPNCDFHLHESCFQLKKDIHHKSHPEHPLTLLPLAPYNNKNGEFTCNACFSDGTGFTYHCSICKLDLHIQCVSLPETVKRGDHEHALKLFYSYPMKVEEYTLSCEVCHGEVQKDRWVYHCESCDYGTHLGCVDCEECEVDSITDAQAQLNSVMDARAQLQKLQIQMQMAREQAQLMASMGSSLANLV